MANIKRRDNYYQYFIIKNIIIYQDLVAGTGSDIQKNGIIYLGLFALNRSRPTNSITSSGQLTGQLKAISKLYK